MINYFNLASIEEAICELFKGKLTTDAENHSGEGIFFSSKLMDNFFIASSGKIFTNNKYDDSRVLDMALGNSQGTFVYMELSNFSHKEAGEVQAKRVCNRLEKFEEVIVDFEGISWMGQGFAHQIFVVFANSHTDITITPINMNEDVTKMYNHVRNSE